MLRVSFVILMSCVFVLAQVPGNDHNVLPETKKTERDNPNVIPNTINEVDLGYLRLAIPTGLVRLDEKNCLEGPCSNFVGEGMSLSIDSSPFAWHPTFQRQYPRFAERVLVIDSVRAKIWSFEYKGLFVAGANYGTGRGGKIGFGIYLQSSTKDIREIAEKAFLSVKFKEKTE